MSGQQVTHDVFDAVSDITRRGIMELLTSGEMSIASIKEAFPISRTAVNKHLRVLLDAGVVTKRKVGKETRYSLRPEPLAVLVDWISYFDRFWDEKLAALQESVEKKE